MRIKSTKKKEIFKQPYEEKEKTEIEENVDNLKKFLNPQDDGLFLENGEFKSPNFVKNLKGWKIDSQGNAYFKSITAGSYIQVFVQASIPTSIHKGDIWYDSDDNNKMYVAEKIGADEITAGEWVERNNPTEWADVLDGASTKPADNATENTGALADKDDVGTAEIQNNVEITNSMCEIQKFEAGEDIAQGKALIVGDGQDTDNLTIDDSGTNGTDGEVCDAKWEGQGFITPSLIYKIISVSVYGTRSAHESANGKINLAIRTNTGGTVGGSNLVSKALNQKDLSRTLGYVTFTFASPLTVSAGSLYAIIMYGSDGTLCGSDPNDKDWNWRQNTGNPYNHNYCYRIRSDNSGSSFYNVVAHDKRCYITYQATHAGKIYLASAAVDNCFLKNFVGFANQAASKNADVEICMGRLYRRALAGVNEGGKYHLKDSPRGDISTTPGTITKQIAIGMKDSYLFQIFDA